MPKFIRRGLEAIRALAELIGEATLPAPKRVPVKVGAASPGVDLPDIRLNQGAPLVRLFICRWWVAGPQQPWQLGFPESQRSQVGAR